MGYINAGHLWKRSLWFTQMKIRAIYSGKIHFNNTLKKGVRYAYLY